MSSEPLPDGPVSTGPLSTERCTITLRDPGDLLGAIPALLGFVPQRSLVVICFAEASPRVHVTMRHDIELHDDGSPTSHMLAIIDHLARVAFRDRVGAVIAVVVDDRAPIDDTRWDGLLDAVAHDFSFCGPIVGFVVGDLVADAPWRAVQGAGPVRGRVPDPHSTPMAVAHAVVNGRRVATTREEMLETLRPGPHCADGCRGREHRPRGDTDESGARDAERLRAVLSAVRSGPPSDCDTIASLGAALASARVRDALLALASSDAADAAECLWEDLVRRLRGPQRAAAATLLAHLNYVRGSGAMAGIALDVALAAAPEYSMARLLDRALRAGMPLASLDGLTVTSRAVADNLGVQLPPADAAAAPVLTEPNAPDHPRTA